MFELSKKYYEQYLVKEISFQEHRRKRLKALFGDHLSNEAADLLFNHYLTLYTRNWTSFEDVIPCLNHLKDLGCRLGIISNGDNLQQIEKLEKLHIQDYFECIITSSEVGVAKPNETIFLEASKIANVNIKECYYVGDQLETDTIGSNYAGMIGIWLNRKQVKRTNCDVKEIHHLLELDSIFHRKIT